MNKTELIEHIANNADISKAAAARALESTIEAVKKTLKKGGTVSLVGFGTFAVGKRAARTGRNPRTLMPCLLLLGFVLVNGASSARRTAADHRYRFTVATRAEDSGGQIMNVR